jgi:hypothetical protein
MGFVINGSMRIGPAQSSMMIVSGETVLWDASSLTTDLLNNSITNTSSVTTSTSVKTIGSQSALINARYQRLTWPSNSAPGTQDFFYGIWARWTRYGSGNPSYLVGFGDGKTANTQMIIAQNPSYYSTGLVLYTGNNYTSYATNHIPSENTWHHIALSRQGSTYRIFVNGTIRGTFTINGLNFTEPFRVGSGSPWWNDPSAPGAETHTNGYINSAQLVIGRPVVTSNFTITSPDYRLTV